MGCDIHLYEEIKINNEWQLLREIGTPRFYTLFALMADVRNNGTIDPISMPKGIPAGLSDQTLERLSSWNGDAHSESYFEYDEIKFLFTLLRKMYKDEKNILSDVFPESQALVKYQAEVNDIIVSNFDEIRWVFWFDN